MLRKCIRNVIGICVLVCLAGAFVIANAQTIQPEAHDPFIFRVIEIVMGVILGILSWSLLRVVKDFDATCNALNKRLEVVEIQQKQNIIKLTVVETRQKDCPNCPK